MSEMQQTSEWLKFFTEAGIPASDATNYAITFSDNRIKQDMLPDLNKEYLKDMGINVLGDIIAILKHAKTVNGQLTRQRAFPSVASLASSKRSASPQVTVKENSSPISNGRKNTPATRIIEHYIRKESPPASPVISASPAISSSLSARLKGNSTKRIHEDEDDHLKSTKRSSVFNRLGDNMVSSTTSDAPKITMTMLGKEKLRSVSEPSTKPMKRMRMDEEQHVVSNKKTESLQYHGILKYSSKELDEKILSIRDSVASSSCINASSRSTTASKSTDSISTAGIRGRLGSANKKAVHSEGIFAKDYKESVTIKSKGKSLKTKIAKPENKLSCNDSHSLFKAEENDSANVLSGKKVIKKIVRINKKTGQIISERSAKRSTVFSRLGD